MKESTQNLLTQLQSIHADSFGQVLKDAAPNDDKVYQIADTLRRFSVNLLKKQSFETSVTGAFFDASDRDDFIKEACVEKVDAITLHAAANNVLTQCKNES